MFSRLSWGQLLLSNGTRVESRSSMWVHIVTRGTGAPDAPDVQVEFVDMADGGSEVGRYAQKEACERQCMQLIQIFPKN